MTFLSTLATLVAILLVAFGVNLSEPQQLDEAAATQAPIESTVPQESEQPTGGILQSPSPSSEEMSQIQTMQSAPSSAQPSVSPAGADQTVAPTQTANAWISQSDAESDAQVLAAHIYDSLIRQTPYASPEFVQDNADTHLTARWVDYMRAKIKAGEAEVLAAFNRPGVVPALSSISIDGENAICKVKCAISIKTEKGGIYAPEVTFTLKYSRAAHGTRQVIALDIAGDADYAKLAVSEGGDISAIDAAVDAAIGELGAVEG